MLQTKIIKILNKNNLTIASVESYTGGLFGSTIVKKSGSSKYFKGTLVTYNNDIKDKFNINTKNGVVNSITAKEMALNGKDIFDVDFCLSFTGNAGPNILDNKPVGLVYIGINSQVFEFKFKIKNRTWIRKKSIKLAFKEFYKILINSQF